MWPHDDEQVAGPGPQSGHVKYPGLASSGHTNQPPFSTFPKKDRMASISKGMAGHPEGFRPQDSLVMWPLSHDYEQVAGPGPQSGHAKYPGLASSGCTNQPPFLNGKKQTLHRYLRRDRGRSQKITDQ